MPELAQSEFAVGLTTRYPAMNGVLLFASGALVGPPVVLVTMVACLILLAVRAWSGTVGLTLDRRLSLYIDGAIGIFFVLFMVFIIIRFTSLA